MHLKMIFSNPGLVRAAEVVKPVFPKREASCAMLHGRMMYFVPKA